MKDHDDSDATDGDGISDDESVQSSTSTNSRSGRNKKSSSSKSGWSGFQGYNNVATNNTTAGKDSINMNTINYTNLKDVFILDSGSTIDGTIMNPNFVINVCPSQSPIGMMTNVGAKTLTVEAEVPGFGQVWFDPEQMANIFGLSKLSKKFRVTYDSEKEDAFFVYTNDGIIKFGCTSEGLYAYCPTKQFINSVANTKNLSVLPDNNNHSHMISTVESNWRGFTKQQFEDAKKARNLYHQVGAPTVENFKHIIRQKIIKNCPIVLDDINRAEIIFGKDIGALKGKLHVLRIR